MSGLQAAAFEPLVGTTFTAIGEWVPDAREDAGDAEAVPALDVAIVLRKVTVLEMAGPFEQFRLDLEGPADRPLPQGTYVFDPAVGPAPHLFLVPTGEHDGRRDYAASFSVSRATAESVGS